MPDLPFGISAYSRQRGNLPDLPVINMFAEQAPTEQGGVTLQSRAGLKRVQSMGSGPIRATFRKDGVLDGSRITVSGNIIFTDGNFLGFLDGAGPVSIASSPLEVLIAAGGAMSRWDGTTLSRVTFPDNANVAAVVFVAGYFVAIRADTQQFYFSGVLDGSAWDPLDYASAENEPDRLLDAVVVDDVLVLLGSASVEFWPKTGDATLPFAPTSGRVFGKGVIATGCAVKFDNSFAYIGVVEKPEPAVNPSPRVFFAANVPQGLSTVGIEEQLAASTSFALWSYSFEGHEMLVVRLSQGSWLYDAATREWCEYQSYGRANWRPRCASGGLFGDDQEGVLWAFDAYADDGGVLERRFRAGFPLSGGSLSCDSIRLRTNPGQTQTLAGQTFDPQVEMRSSRDRANTWTGWRRENLGQQGKYRTRVEWRRNGRFDEPGGLFEFRCTDPVPFGASGVSMNEMKGGRSR